MSTLLAGTGAKYTVIDADYLDNEEGVIAGAAVEASKTEDAKLLAITSIEGAPRLDEPYIVSAGQLRALP